MGCPPDRAVAVVKPVRPAGGRGVLLVMLLGAIGCTSGVATEPDWSRVQLAWLGDPRPQADVPAGVEAVPMRRPSRRAQRRAARRGMPLDEFSPPAQEPRSGTGSSDTDPSRLPPLGVDATLGSPFAAGDAASKPTIHRDQPYGSQGHPRQKFDLYLPPGCSGGGIPLVVWIHGDDWRSGSKSPCPITWLVEKGYAVASIGYRLSDAALFPAQLDDCRAAIATISRDAELWGIDRERICVVGQAAGGHLAALVAFAPGDEPGDSAEVDDVAAVCAVCAPTHLTSLGGPHDRGTSPASQLVGGPLQEFREAAQRASPLEHVSADDPPALLVHERSAAQVPVDQSIRLDRGLKAAGVESTLVVLDQASEKPLLAEGTPAGVALVEFLDRVLAAATAKPPEPPTRTTSNPAP
jgi:acetyl esterase/lipase